MKAVIVTIGDELLIGQVIDTNSVYIARELEAIGCTVMEKVAIADTVEAIGGTMERYQNRADLVVLTGGLGPTKDDVTKKTFAHYFDDELVLNEEVYVHVKKLIENFYRRPITEMNRQQAFVPAKCKVLFNEVGTAPGMLMVKEHTAFVSLPGVPFEMRFLVDHKVIPYVKETFKLEAIVHKTVLTAGIGESLLAEKVESWEEALASSGIRLAYLPQLGQVRLRLSKTGTDSGAILKEMEEKIKELKLLIPEYFVGISDTDSLFDELVPLLKEANVTLATAESCTGGSIASKLSAVEGASAYFKGGAVTYATESKFSVLGVQKETVEAFSVVSEEVAREMALGARKLYKADIAVATTGNAGPSKGDSDAEVGTVCIALAAAENVHTYTFNFGQSRSVVIQACLEKVWLLLYKYLKNRL